MPFPQVTPVPVIDLRNSRFSFIKKESASRGVRDMQREMGAFAGALVRREARQSIRKAVVDRKRSRQFAGSYTYYKEQPPGQPPRYRGSKDAGVRAIVYAWDSQRKSVVVGPMKYPSSRSPVVAGLEGTRKVTVTRTRRRKLRIGSGAAIEQVGSLSRGSRNTKVISTDTPIGLATVRFIRIATTRQLARAVQLQARLFKGSVTHDLRPRPYMRPALSRMKYGKIVKGERRSIESMWEKKKATFAAKPRRRGQR